MFYSKDFAHDLTMALVVFTTIVLTIGILIGKFVI